MASFIDPKEFVRIEELEDLDIVLPQNTTIPSQTGQSGKVLSTNGTSMSWINLPTSSGSGTVITSSGPDVEYISVKDFGAKGDMTFTLDSEGNKIYSGGADDTAAFQAALNAQTTTGKTIFIPQGGYRILGTLTYSSAPRLVGAGMDKTVLHCLAPGITLAPAASVMQSSSDTLFRDFCAKGRGQNATTKDIFFRSQQLQVNWNMRFDHLFVRDWSYAGVLISDSYDCYFTNCRAWFCGTPTSKGGGFMFDRIQWEENLRYATTGAFFQNISTQRCNYGIGAVEGEQMVDCSFHRVTGEFDQWTINTCPPGFPTSPPDTYYKIGNNGFYGCYAEQNFIGGFSSVNGTVIEDYAAAFPGAGHNYPSFDGPYVRTNQGQLQIYDGTPIGLGVGNPGINFWNVYSDYDKENVRIEYNASLHAYTFNNGALDPMFLIWNGNANGGLNYVQVRNPSTPDRGTIGFGESGAMLDFTNGTFDFSAPVRFPSHEGNLKIVSSSNAQVILHNTSKRIWALSADNSGAMVAYDASGDAAVLSINAKDPTGANDGTVTCYYGLHVEGATTFVGDVTTNGNLSIGGSFSTNGLTARGTSNPALILQNTGAATARTWNVSADNSKALAFYDNQGAVTPVYIRAKDASGVNNGKLVTNYGIEFAAGTGMKILEGGNNAFSGATWLIPGTTSSVTVANTNVTAESRIHLTCQNSYGAAPGVHYISARVPGVSFTISSTVPTDGSKVAWLIIDNNG